MATEVYVVTNTECGWDCVVAVFNADSVSLEAVKEKFSGKNYVVTFALVEKDMFEYE